MRGFFILVLICLLTSPSPAEAFPTKQKNCKSPQTLEQRLKKEPMNTKLLKQKADIEVAHNNYQEAIIFFERLQKIEPFSIDEEKFLAFLYSRIGNYVKSVEIIENIIQEYPESRVGQNNTELPKLALEYSMAGKNWDKAIVYTDKMLEFEPNSENLLKSKGDLYLIKQDLPNAIKAYGELVKISPTLEHKLALAQLFMEYHDFANACAVLGPIYKENPNDSKIADSYLNVLLAQNKTREAYNLLKTHNLLETKEGFIVSGDLAMLDENFGKAANAYCKAFKLDPNNLIVQNKLALAYRSGKCINASAKIYQSILAKDPNNMDAKLGLAALEVDKKNFEQARCMFQSILNENPDYLPAKIEIVNSYLINDDNLQALEYLKKMPQDDKIKLMMAETYYKMGMYSDASKMITEEMKTQDFGYESGAPSDLYNLKNISPEMNAKLGQPEYESDNAVLNGSVYENSKDLSYKIKRSQAVILTPSYSFLIQKLAQEFKLDYHRFGIQMEKMIEGNKNVFVEYNNYIYSSGDLNQLNNVTNEFRGGIQARPTELWEYRADLGVKSFEFGDGAMLNTDSWIKHYFSDSLNLKIGAKRNNMEQSYVAAVGEPIDGIFTGRAANNKFYFEFQKKFPSQIYTYGLGSYGVITAQNLVTNQYVEGMIGIGKLLYNNPKNKWVNTFSTDLVSYNSSYQFNLLDLYSRTGRLYGGYFSPGYFNATTINFKLEGKIRQWNLKYGLKAFGGIQNAITPDSTTQTWGVAPYISYHLNDNVSFNVTYNHFTYADVQRDQLILNAVIRGFDKHAKN